MASARERVRGGGSARRGRAVWLLVAGVFALLIGATGPLAHGLGIASSGSSLACVGTGEHEPGEPRRHAPDGCAVCLTIQAGATAGLVGIGCVWSAPWVMDGGMVREVEGGWARVASLDDARARGPPSDCA